MHELGIVMHVIKQVEAVAEENEVEQVTALNLEVGEVSSIVPDLFRDCFDWAKKKTKFMRETQLNLIVLEAISFCNDCQRTYKTTEYSKVCPYCGKSDTYLVTGNEMNIKDIEVK